MPGQAIPTILCEAGVSRPLICIEEVLSWNTGLIADRAEGGALELLVVWHGERGTGAVGVSLYDDLDVCHVAPVHFTSRLTQVNARSELRLDHDGLEET